MTTLLLLIAFTLVFNLALYYPLKMRRRALARELGLQRARAEIAACAEAMQVYLAKRHIVRGDLVHDIHYEAINCAQYFDKYIAFRPLVSKDRKSVREMQRKIREEVDQLPQNIKKISTRFIAAYLKAAYYRHPFKFWALILYALARVLKHRVVSHAKSTQKVGEKRAKVIEFKHARPVIDARVPVYAIAATWFIATGVTSFRAPTNTVPCQTASGCQMQAITP